MTTIEDAMMRLAAKIGAIGATDPAAAMDLVTKNRKILGSTYDEMHDKYRVQANEAIGKATADKYLAETTPAAAQANASSIANPAQPIYQQITGLIPGGFTPGGLARLVQIESGGRPDAVSPSRKHVGLTRAATTRQAKEQ